MAYKFDPDVLARISQEVIEYPLETGQRFTALIERLSRHYPDFVENRQRRWIGSRAGGILGKITFLYVGFTEYLLIFGSPCGTQGFSGRYNYMTIFKTVLGGKITTYDLESEQLVPTVLLPGSSSSLQSGRSLGLTFEPGSWHLEYGRGPNITAMAFGLADTLISSVDFRSFFLTMSEYTRFVVKHLFGGGKN